MVLSEIHFGDDFQTFQHCSLCFQSQYFYPTTKDEWANYLCYDVFFFANQDNQVTAQLTNSCLRAKNRHYGQDQFIQATYFANAAFFQGHKQTEVWLQLINCGGNDGGCRTQMPVCKIAALYKKVAQYLTQDDDEERRPSF